MSGQRELVSSRRLARVGSLCAITGSVVSVAAGAAYGDRPSTSEPSAALRYVESQPDWVWPWIQLGFVAGAVLWVAAFVVLSLLMERTARTVSWMGAALAVLGASVHAVNAAVEGVAIASLSADQAGGELLLLIVDGTWALTVALFHGLPFVVYGWLVAVSGVGLVRVVGALGALAGAASVVLGGVMFLGPVEQPWLAILAVSVSLWMLVVGTFLWFSPSSIVKRVG